MPRTQAGAVLADQKVYVIGGLRPIFENDCDTVESFDVGTHQSVSVPAMHLPYPWAAMVTVRTPAGIIYAIGGSGPPENCYEWVSSPVQSFWLKRDDMPEVPSGPTGVLGPDGKIYIIGGRVPTSNAIMDLVQCFDPVSGTWSQVGQIAKLKTPRFCAVAATAGEKIYVFGGFTGATWPWTLIRTVEEYDPNANKWTLLTEEHSMIPTPRWYCAAVTGSNGRIYLIGGCYSCGSVTDAVEEFDPVGKKWRVLSPMPTARAAPVAVATPDGRLLVLGGERMMTYHSASMGIDYEEWGVTDEIEEGTLPTIFP